MINDKRLNLLRLADALLVKDGQAPSFAKHYRKQSVKTFGVRQLA